MTSKPKPSAMGMIAALGVVMGATVSLSFVGGLVFHLLGAG